MRSPSRGAYISGRRSPPGLASPVRWEMARPGEAPPDDVDATPISCGACCEVLEKPVALDCGHRFCGDCLEKAVCMARGRTDGALQCPQCDERSSGSHTLSDPRLPQFPNAALGLPATRPPYACDWCEAAPPDSYCEDCKTSLCRACVALVHRKRNMSAHSVVPIAARANSYQRCGIPGHDRAFVKYYCRACSKPACPECVAEQHGDAAVHDVVGIRDVVGHVVDRMRRRLARTEDAKHRLKELLAGNHRTRLQFNTTAVAYEQQVRHLFSALRRQITHEEDAMVAQLRSSFQAGRTGLLQSTEQLMALVDTANHSIAGLSRFIETVDGDTGNGAAVAAISALGGEMEEFPVPSFDGTTVPRGGGFLYEIPEYHIPNLQKSTDLRLDLRDVPVSSTLLNLAFPPQPHGGNVAVEHTPEGTALVVRKLCGWGSVKATQTMVRSKYQWRLRLHTFNLMVGVAAKHETRPDLHKGHGFFWYTDIQGAPFGQLGRGTPAFEALPPLIALGRSSVDVTLTYDADAGTLAVKIGDTDHGVVGEGIHPPVQAAVSFIDDDQRVVVLTDQMAA